MGQFCAEVRDGVIISWRRGRGWEMGEICPKTKSYPPLIKQKINFKPSLT